MEPHTEMNSELCLQCERLRREYYEAHKAFLSIAGVKAEALIQQNSAALARFEAL
jgi:hypothetical protein